MSLQSTATTEASSGTSSLPSTSSAIAPEMAAIEQQLLELERRREELERIREAKAQEESMRIYHDIDTLKAKYGLTADQELITIVRNRGLKSEKGKRIPDTTLKQIRAALTAGAKVPEVAKHFGLSPATINTRKKQWKLVHRKNVKLIPLKEAFKKAGIPVSA